MKTNYSHNCLIFFLLLYFGFIQNVKAQVDTLFINESFISTDLNKISNRFSTNNPINISEAYKKSYSNKNNSNTFAFFNINEDLGFLTFTIHNKTEKPQNLVIEIYNALINEISLYEKTTNSFELINTSGTDFPFRSRLKNDRNFLYPITLSSLVSKSYIFQFKKNKISIVVPAKIWTAQAFQKQNKQQYLFIGMYYGLCLISIIISLYIYYILRKKLYILYATYIVFLGLYLFSYLGLYFQFFSSNTEHYNKYIHVFFTVGSMVLFVLFSIKVLNAKTIAHNLVKFLYVFLGLTISIRFAEFYLPQSIFSIVKPFIIKFWYVSFLIINSILILLIIKSYTYQKKITLLYTMAYSFLGIGTILTIINLSTGHVNAFAFGLPIIFYASFLEIVFLTFTIILMVKGIYDERNILSKKIVVQEKKNLTAFIKGEDQERKRISKELHDNIGSQLSYLKRFVSDAFNNEEVTKAIDTICNDVRNLSHEISPSDLKIVGFESAVEDLSQNISAQTTLNVNFNSYQFPESLDDEIATQLYRVVQEAFNNILKHAKAKQVDVQLMGHNCEITISIEDDGKGFNTSNEIGGLGLKNMHSRIYQIGGTLSIDSQISKGTSVLITLPVR
ncbi:hypothetical protein GCM10023311_15690 [Flaviramulus aquimarinus]|uniref:histidine kinase n=1 Tax=Flaviramulus aquimarinus TaxID=1170456 RepID=A0ABP9F4W1_9FLAO